LSGVLITLLATKHLYEKGSAESKDAPSSGFLPPHVEEFSRKHSLTIFLVITGVGWAVLYSRMDTESRWGEVVSNIVSELMEVGSKESR